VIFILEIAFTAFRESPQYLRPPFFDYDNNFSKGKCTEKNCEHKKK
jgi:hypothetical protein